jgi:hypothetical protein
MIALEFKYTVDITPSGDSEKSLRREWLESQGYCYTMKYLYNTSGGVPDVQTYYFSQEEHAVHFALMFL